MDDQNTNANPQMPGNSSQSPIPNQDTARTQNIPEPGESRQIEPQNQPAQLQQYQPQQSASNAVSSQPNTDQSSLSAPSNQMQDQPIQSSTNLQLTQSSTPIVNQPIQSSIPQVQPQTVQSPIANPVVNNAPIAYNSTNSPTPQVQSYSAQSPISPPVNPLATQNNPSGQIQQQALPNSLQTPKKSPLNIILASIAALIAITAGVAGGYFLSNKRIDESTETPANTTTDVDSEEIEDEANNTVTDTVKPTRPAQITDVQQIPGTSQGDIIDYKGDGFTISYPAEMTKESSPVVSGYTAELFLIEPQGTASINVLNVMNPYSGEDINTSGCKLLGEFSASSMDEGTAQITSTEVLKTNSTVSCKIVISGKLNGNDMNIIQIASYKKPSTNVTEVKMYIASYGYVEGSYLEDSILESVDTFMLK